MRSISRSQGRKESPTSSRKQSNEKAPENRASSEFSAKSWRLGLRFGPCRGGGCNGGRGFFFLAAGALDAGSLTPQITQVIQAGAANLAFADYFDGADRRRM